MKGALFSIAIITISVSLLSRLLFMSLQPFAFVEAQNLTNTSQTNNSESRIYIPPTISKEAQEILKRLTMTLPTFVTPGSERRLAKIKPTNKLFVRTTVSTDCGQLST
jgi:hypothetical protein